MGSSQKYLICAWTECAPVVGYLAKYDYKIKLINYIIHILNVCTDFLFDLSITERDEL